MSTPLPSSGPLSMSALASVFPVTTPMKTMNQFTALGDPLLPKPNQSISFGQFKGRRYTVAFHVDGADTRSYPGTGTAWTNLAPTPIPNIAGTLTDTTYDPSTKGHVFNGSTSICRIPNPGFSVRTNQPITFQIAFNWTGNTTGTRGLMGFRGLENLESPVHIELQAGGFRSRLGGVELNSMTLPTANTNVLVSIVHTGSSTHVYYNTSLIREDTTMTTGPLLGTVNPAGDGRFNIGESIANAVESRRYIGTIYNVMIHFEALTLDEITQIYNRLKPVYALA